MKQETAGKTVYWLSDPAIHCQHDILRFTKTNLGVKGVESFFRVHKCSDACRALGLQVPKQEHGATSGTCISLDDWTDDDYCDGK